MSTKGRSDYYAPGDWNACCDRCAAKFKASKLKRDWRGFMLCEWCWEPRHPQDFVRGLADPTPVPWSRQCSHDNLVEVCAVPTASFTTEVSAEDPLTISYASTTPASDACPVTCEYDFGDGGTSTSCSGTHTYAAGGTYTISYTATSPGGEDIATAALTVVEPPPSYATELFIDFDSVTIGIAAAAGVTFDSPFAVWNDWSGDTFNIYDAPNGGNAGGFHTSLTPAATLVINIDTNLLRVRNLDGQSLYTSSDTVRVYTEGGGVTSFSRDISSTGAYHNWSDGPLVVASVLTANGYPTEYITRIEFDLTAGSYLLMDALYFF